MPIDHELMERTEANGVNCYLVKERDHYDNAVQITLYLVVQDPDVITTIIDVNTQKKIDNHELEQYGDGSPIDLLLDFVAGIANDNAFIAEQEQRLGMILGDLAEEADSLAEAKQAAQDAQLEFNCIQASYNRLAAQEANIRHATSMNELHQATTDYLTLSGLNAPSQTEIDNAGGWKAWKMNH